MTAREWAEGDGNTDDTVRIADVSAHRVTVREMIGGHDSWVGGRPHMLAEMRALAVRALRADHPPARWKIVRTDAHYWLCQWFATYEARPRD
jgi:hypothetical protein